MPADAPRRLVSLDVLRGLAILLMVFSGMLPKSLPNWLDHGYQPHYRPDAAGVWVSTLVSGSPPVDARWKAFTWVDLVFPMFLFAMGTAIPIAMSRRLERGEPPARAIATAAGRAVTLAIFAVAVTQMTTWQLSWPDSGPDAARARALLGLVGVFLFFVRWRSPLAALASRAAGLAVVVGLIVAGVRSGASFAWSESDVIILVLAHTYVVAATLWVLTRGWRWWRLVVVAPLLMVAHYRQFGGVAWSDWRWMGDLPLVLTDAATTPGEWLNLNAWFDTEAWSKQARALLNLSPLWNVTWYKFLWCVVPGTIVGDAVLAWSRRSMDGDDGRLSRQAVLGLAVAIVVAVCVGFRHYGFSTLGLGGPLRTPWLAPVLALPLLVAMAALVRRGDAAQRGLMRVGGIALAIGLLLACLPSGTAREGFFEGGISKGSPATLSYYATSVGLCVLLLLGLLVVFDAPSRPARTAPGVVEANGQNPLLAYFLAHSTVGAIFTLSIFAGFNRAVGANVWLDVGWAVVRTALIAAVVWGLTRRRIVWRA